ncbi:hypothetical protein M9979_15745 [Sphingomonas sp. RP10(2022)]|uniref:Uncharacterized protein n=1 Tax=Sphingomonas liriopis TaxID=2949094 RepID=A0A9X2HTM0_9SPHN|nr:hypothetical protein [Sphingomonas liriopis]MCP3736322.1 hypothetical protein [Sphingomonas liriopis]
MTKALPLALIAAASLCCGSSAFAQGTKPTTTAKTVATSRTTTTTKPAIGKPTATTKTTVKTATAAKGRMVTTKTSTGKTITYDCGKAGNANKAACKK